MSNFNIKPTSFIQKVLDNIKLLGPTLATSLNSLIIGNTTTYTVAGSISEGDPVFLQGDGKVCTAFGKLANFNENISPNTIHVLPYSTNKIVILYKDTADSNNLKIVVAELNSTQTTLTFGTPGVVLAAVPDEYSIAYNDSRDEFFIHFGTASGTELHHRIGTISGTTIALGADITDYTGTITSSKVVFDSSAKNYLLFVHTAASSLLCLQFDTLASLVKTTTVALSVTGLGPAIYDSTSARTLVSYTSSGNKLIAIRSLATYIVLGTPVSSTVITDLTLDVQNERIVAIATTDLQTIQINPTFLTITIGSSTASGLTSTDILSTEGGIFTIDNDSITSAIIGASDNITAYSSYTYYSSTSTGSVLAYSGGKLIILLVTNEGTLGYFIFEPHLPFIPNIFIGISKGDYVDGEVANINFIGINENQTGLVPGETYYLGPTQLTTQIREVQIGVALSSTSILFSTSN